MNFAPGAGPRFLAMSLVAVAIPIVFIFLVWSLLRPVLTRIDEIEEQRQTSTASQNSVTRDSSNSSKLVAVILLSLLSSTVLYAKTLTTLFESDGGFAGNTFDIEVLHPAGIGIQGFDINIDPRGVLHEIHIYWRSGTSAGHEGSPDGWNLMGMDNTVNSLGRDEPRFVGVSSPPLASGLYGIYVDVFSYIVDSEQLRFTSGSATYANADLRIITRTSQGAPAFFGDSLPDQQWNGTIHYVVLPEPSTLALLGATLLVAVVSCGRKRR